MRTSLFVDPSPPTSVDFLTKPWPALGFPPTRSFFSLDPRSKDVKIRALRQRPGNTESDASAFEVSAGPEAAG